MVLQPPSANAIQTHMHLRSDEICLHADVDEKLSVFVMRWTLPTLWKGCYLLLARALPPVVFMGLLYSCMAISLYVPVWYNHDPFGTRPNLKLSWRSKGLPRERLSSLVVMPQEGRCSILYLMSIIECRIPPQSCVLFLEHSAPVSVKGVKLTGTEFGTKVRDTD